MLLWQCCLKALLVSNGTSVVDQERLYVLLALCGKRFIFAVSVTEP